MPGIITHYICGEAVIRELEEPIRNVIQRNRQYFNVGTQGPDIFFYYIPAILRKSFGNLGTKMHNANFSEFMKMLLNDIQKSPVRDNLFSYLSGFLSHYALDCAAHPYIYYKSGFAREKPSQCSKCGKRIRAAYKIKYSVYHRRFETAIDVLMLKLVNSEKPSEKKLWQLIKLNKKEALRISGLLSEAIRGAYGVPIKSAQVYRAMAHMAYATRFLQSNSGKRKKFIEIAENITIREHLISSLIHTQNISDEIDYLNLKKSPWLMPWDNTRVYNSSFTDLFEKAVIESSKMIMALHKFTHNIISADEFLTIIGDNSFSSGVDSSQKIEFAYSDIVFEGGVKSLLNKQVK